MVHFKRIIIYRRVGVDKGDILVPDFRLSILIVKVTVGNKRVFMGFEPHPFDDRVFLKPVVYIYVSMVLFFVILSSTV